jgi:hypothetical protein
MVRTQFSQFYARRGVASCAHEGLMGADPRYALHTAPHASKAPQFRIMFAQGLCGVADQVLAVGVRRESPRRGLSLLGDPTECRSTLGEANRRRDLLSEEADSARLCRAYDAARQAGTRGAPKNGRRICLGMLNERAGYRLRRPRVEVRRREAKLFVAVFLRLDTFAAFRAAFFLVAPL